MPISKAYFYFIKKINHQEMGSQTYRGGPSSRGRYFLIPKNPRILKIFPYLSPTELNSAKVVELCPLNLMDQANVVPRIYCSFVYHNSKIAEGKPNGRDEYRIYLTKALDDGLFFKGDYVVFRRWTSNQDNDSEQAIELNEENIHLVQWIRRDLCPDQCAWYDRLVNSEGAVIKGTSAVYVGFLESFEKKASQAIPSDQAVIGSEFVQRIKNMKSEADRSERNETHPGSGKSGEKRWTRYDPDGVMDKYKVFQNMFSSATFREVVLVTYGSNCAVTHQCLNWNGQNNLEAAHIYAACYGGTYIPQNGIAMRRDIHWAYDKGMFTVLPESMKIKVHPEMKHSYLGQYDGMKVQCDQPVFAPAPDFLYFHSKMVYGIFLKGESLADLKTKIN